MASKTKIVGYKIESIGDEVRISDSEGESVQSSDVNRLLFFLNEPYTDEVYFAIKVLWDLDEGLSPILKMLGVAACKQLASPEHEYRGLFYIPSKVFRIDADGHMSFFYHLSQYYIDDPEPETAEEIASLGIDVLQAYRSMGFNPKKFTSPVAIYKEEVLSHMQIPTVQNIPGGHEDLINYALDCTGRLWIQAYQIGHWGLGEILEYDLRAAFPSVMANLYSLQYARHAESQSIPEDADWGFMKGIVTIYDDTKVSHIFYEDDGGKTQRTGTWRTTLSLQDYKFIKKYGTGEFQIENGHFIKFTAPVKPMEMALKRLFHQRGMGGIINSLAKRMATGTYGICLEQHDDGSVGMYYNPIYAAMINSLNNVRVAEFIYKNGLVDDLVHVGVDSVLTTKYVPLNPHKGGFGKWNLTDISDCIVLSSGRVYHGSKKPQGLNYSGIIKLIKEHPRSSYYTAKLKRRQTLEESIALNDLAGLGRYKDTTSSFDLNLIGNSLDRDFEGYPCTGAELLNKRYDSKPLKAVEYATV